MKFIIFHGAFGGPSDNWFPELKESLELIGQKVISQQFPVEDWDEINKIGPSFVPKKQTLNNWLNVFEKNVLPLIKNKEKICFIGHSLAPVFILHIVEKFSLKLDSAIFVSPFMDKIKGNFWQFDLVNSSFYKTDFNFDKLKKLIPTSYVLYSENDPYVSRNHSILFAKALDSSIIFVKKAGHMNSSVNLNEFPLVLELCKTRIDMNLYQKYIEHRKDLFFLNYAKGKHEEVIYLKSSDIFDEGMFHFRNIKKSGFCTFFTGLNNVWDAQQEYYKEARKAAKRVKEFIRVFVINKISDCNSQSFRNHIDLDLKSGIKIYLVMYEDIRNDTEEPDFGIWDNEYLCIVKNTKTTEVKLSSRKVDIKKALVWKNNILSKATLILNSTTDIDNFIKK